MWKPVVTFELAMKQLGGDAVFQDHKSDRIGEREPRAPAALAQPGQEVGPGDYILSVDGVGLTSGTNPYSLFENKVGAQVLLEIGPNPDGKDSREIIVEPIRSESSLRYTAWVEANRRRVDELSGGNKDTRDRYLVVWLFEHRLKETYARFVEALDQAVDPPQEGEVDLGLA